MARGEVVGLRLGLDAFHHDAQLQCLGHGENLRKNRNGDSVGSDGLCKRLVDLDGVDREVVQVSEARIAGAEIVDGDVVASLAETKDGVASDLLACGIAFGDLDPRLRGETSASASCLSSIGMKSLSARSAAAIFTLTRKVGRARSVAPKSRSA